MIVTDGYVLPFSEVLDWSRASIRVHSHDLNKLFTTILTKISTEHETELREQVRLSIICSMKLMMDGLIFIPKYVILSMATAKLLYGVALVLKSCKIKYVAAKKLLQSLLNMNNQIFYSTVESVYGGLGFCTHPKTSLTFPFQ